MTESTVFYKSLFDALADFPPENYKTAMQAIAGYAFTGEEPDGLPLLENTVFLLVKPQIDKAARLTFLEALLDYQFYGTRPENLPPTTKMSMTAILPELKAEREKQLRRERRGK